MNKIIKIMLTAVAVLGMLVFTKLLSELYDEKIKKVYFDV